ncbi:MAG: ATP-binding protein [Oscillospiraceae bacterium]
MIRKIIHIDEEKCNGCGACATACHEGAIGIVNGEAKLLRDDYRDGFGDCLPACPMDAIHFVEREAAAYDEAAVQANKRKKQVQAAHAAHAGGCLRPPDAPLPGVKSRAAAATPAAQPSRARPVAVPDQARAAVSAPYFQGAKLLIAADCTAYAYANMHSEFHEREDHAHRLPEARCGGLHRQAHGDHPGQRHSERDHRAHGGAVLRRTRARGAGGAARERKVPCHGRSSRSRSDGKILDR